MKKRAYYIEKMPLGFLNKRKEKKGKTIYYEEFENG